MKRHGEQLHYGKEQKIVTNKWNVHLILYTPTLVHNNHQLQTTIVIMNQFLLDLGSYIYV
jgi:hypothetical protein